MSWAARPTYCRTCGKTRSTPCKHDPAAPGPRCVACGGMKAIPATDGQPAVRGTHKARCPYAMPPGFRRRTRAPKKPKPGTVGRPKQGPYVRISIAVEAVIYTRLMAMAIRVARIEGRVGFKIGDVINHILREALRAEYCLHGQIKEICEQCLAADTAAADLERWA